jgi:ubiquinone/menaquinone biosynthesis C-methylase UbiE
MLNYEWPADDYAIGSYIQATTADRFLPSLHLPETAYVLDIGCGNGSYTEKILTKVPHGTVLGIDPSENMLALAEKVSNKYSNFHIKKENVLNMNYTNQFDCVVSFWCLQWVTDIKQAFTNIHKALKPNGTVFTILPAGDDPFINAYYAVKRSRQFSCLRDFKAPVDYSELNELEEKLKTIPFKSLKVTLEHPSIILPSLDIFKKFVNGIAFYNGQVSDSDIKQINEAMVSWYEQECITNWQGEHRFNCSLYLVTGEK